MKKLKKEEFDAIPLHGRGNTSVFYDAMLNLKPGGDGLHISKAEWKRKYAPTKMARRIEKKYGFVYKTGALPDRSGWGITRVK